MADSTIAIDEPTAIDKRLATEALTVGAYTVERERVQVAGATAAAIGVVTNTTPGGSDYGLVVRLPALPALAAGTNNIGDVDVLTVPAPLNLTGGGVEASALRVTLANDSTGVLSVDDNNSSLTVDGSVSISAVTPGTGTTNLGKAEDAAHASGDVGVMALAVRNEGGVDFSGSDGDYVPIAADAKGHLMVRLGDETLTVVNAAGTANIGDVDVLTVPADPFGVNADAASATGSISAKLRFIARDGGAEDVPAHGAADRHPGPGDALLAADDGGVVEAGPVSAPGRPQRGAVLPGGLPGRPDTLRAEKGHPLPRHPGARRAPGRPRDVRAMALGQQQTVGREEAAGRIREWVPPATTKV